MRELELERSLQEGDRGRQVRLVQEWLCFHGYGLRMDGNYGAATDYAVRAFQGERELAVDGVVGPVTFGVLVEPMRQCLALSPQDGLRPGERVAACALRHLAVHPREIGGVNRGPWVRLYMDGHEGEKWPWCAGFVSFVLRQALGKKAPLRGSFSCDVLALRADELALLLPGSTGGIGITPGSIFLMRRTSQDWVHAGIVVRLDEEVFETVEGNTNDDGNRDGVEVCRRIRSYRGVDFIVI